MIRSLLCSCVFAVLIGCASQAKYEARLDHWVGETEDDLVASFGVPTKTHSLSSGGKVLLFRNRGTAKIGGGSIGPSDVDNGGSTWCETTFNIAASGKVTSWKIDGNACRSK